MKTQPKGNSYDGSKEYTEKQNHTIIILITILLISTVVGLIIYNVTRSSSCNKVEKLILDMTKSYAENNQLLPQIEGESISISVDDVFKKETLKPTLNESICSGTIKITKYKEEYVYTYDITNCDYCSTNNRYKNWSKEIEKKPSKRVLTDVIPYYNYYEISSYHSNWTNWIAEEQIGEVDPTYQVALPLKKEILPKISEEATITKYEKEDAVWYSYRDKHWKYYKDNGGNYSTLSSEQPAGFTSKDTATEMKSDWSEWSLDYPEKKSYRTIRSNTGYRWFYLDGNRKVYWNSGAYTPEQPEKKYDQREKKTVTMYQYQDRMWKWYNGPKRNYSSFTSTPNSKQFTTRDEDLFEYTNWSSYSDQNKQDASNEWYREIQTKTYSRYRIAYTMTSFLKLDQYIPKQEFEDLLQTSIPDFIKRDDIKLDIKYKFKYRKK